MTALAPSVDFQTVDLFSTLATTKDKNLNEWAKKFNRQQKNKHLERNILLGYSLGGRLGLHAAYDKPGLWDEVVLVSAHPGSQSSVEKESRRQSDKEWAEKFLNLPWSAAKNHKDAKMISAAKVWQRPWSIGRFRTKIL
jgi:pimeloyl-ACP methyl ester carboxylesterase